jgi:hypothetical protein
MDAPLAALLRGILATCLDIRAVWSIDHDLTETSVPAGHCKLLVFADAATRVRLHGLRAPDAVQILVVIDGDAFESASGMPTGSLSRWAWRQTAPHEAFYEEARWAAGEEARMRGVMRVRRKALLLWRHERDTRSHERVYKD